MDKVTDVFNSLYSAVVQAQKEVEGKYIENINKSYFEDGKPKTVTVELGGKQIEIDPHLVLQEALLFPGNFDNWIWLRRCLLKHTHPMILCFLYPLLFD